MSVIIQDFNMPSDCYHCSLFDDVRNYCKVLESDLESHQILRRSVCPLIDIQDVKNKIEKKIDECGDPSIPGFFSDANQRTINAYETCLRYLE